MVRVRMNMTSHNLSSDWSTQAKLFDYVDSKETRSRNSKDNSRI